MSAVPDRETSRALLVGTSHYTSLPDLPALSNNLGAPNRVLTDPAAWGLNPGHCATVMNPRSAGDVLAPLRRAATQTTDTLFFYYSGHGLLDDDGDLCLGLVGSAPETLEDSLRYELLRKV